jgi:hypothetical protein
MERTTQAVGRGADASSAEAYAAFIVTDEGKWSRIVKQLGLKAE